MYKDVNTDVNTIDNPYKSISLNSNNDGGTSQESPNKKVDGRSSESNNDGRHLQEVPGKGDGKSTSNKTPKASQKKSKTPKKSQEDNSLPDDLYLQLDSEGKYKELTQDELNAAGAYAINDTNIRLIKGTVLKPYIGFENHDN